MDWGLAKRNHPIRFIDAQIGIRLFGARWRLSSCGAVYLADKNNEMFKHHSPCSDPYKYPLNLYWQSWFEKYSLHTNKVIKEFKKKLPDTKITVGQSKTNKDRWRGSVHFDDGKVVRAVSTTRGSAICLAIVKVLILAEKKKKKSKKK